MKGLLYKTEVFLKKSSPTILSCLGVAGVIATAVMAAKDTPKALQIYEDLKSQREEEPTKLEYASEAWRCYIPTMAVGLSTIVCILGANSLNKRNQAAIASAYMLLDTAYKEYKAKAVDIFGKDTDVKIVEELAKDRINKNDICQVEHDVKLFYEQFFGGYFESTVENVLLAEYEFNQRLIDNGRASLNELFDLLGADRIPGGDTIGWTYHFDSVIDFKHEWFTMDDGLECCIIDSQVVPSLDF